MTKPTQDAGFITRNYEGKKQWLVHLRTIKPFGMDWADKPDAHAMYSKSIFDTLPTNLGLTYRPCARLIIKRNLVWASPEDMIATVNEE